MVLSQGLGHKYRSYSDYYKHAAGVPSELQQFNNGRREWLARHGLRGRSTRAG